MLYAIGHQERHRSIIIPIVGRSADVDRLIVVRIRAAQQRGPFFEMKFYPRAQHQSASQINTLSQHQSSATFLIYFVDGLL